MQRVIFHIDCNSAFLSWEAVYRIQHGSSIDLRNVPSAVGGDSSKRHGIILAKSIPAKKYGIKTGQSLYEAFKKCPQLMLVPPSYDLYLKCSHAMIDILKQYSPLVEQYSIDECFIDMSGCPNIDSDPVKMAIQIKNRIKKELGFTVNVGISSNKLLAKMASDFKKPDRVHTLYKEEIKTKLWPLPVKELFMVGIKTSIKLMKYGIDTIGKLAATDPDILKGLFKSFGQLLWNYANGIDESNVNIESRIVKGIGNSTTTSFDVVDQNTAKLFLLSLSETTAMRLRHQNMRAQVVSVALKSSRFENYSHQKKLETPTDHTTAIYTCACRLFDEMWKEEPLRLLSIRLSDLRSNCFWQTSLFDSSDILKKRKLDFCIDHIREDFGKYAITRASLLHSGIPNMCGGTSADYTIKLSSIL